MKEQYSGYVWLIPGWYPEKWWRAGSDVNCTTSDIEKYLASERVIAISQLPNTTTSEETVNGSVSEGKVICMVVYDTHKHTKHTYTHTQN